MFQGDFVLQLGDLDSQMFAECEAFLNNDSLSVKDYPAPVMSDIQSLHGSGKMADNFEESEMKFMGSFPSTPGSTKQVDFENHSSQPSFRNSSERDTNDGRKLAPVAEAGESRSSCSSANPVVQSNNFRTPLLPSR